MDFSATELIDLARQVEASGQLFYRAAAATVRDPEVRRTLEWLRSEEEQHSHVFERLLATLQRDQGGLAADASDGGWRLDEHYLGHLRAMTAGLVFPDEHAATAAVARLPSVAAVLERALDFEHAAIRFLEGLRERAASDAVAAVDALVKEERSHVEMLQGLMRRL